MNAGKKDSGTWSSNGAALLGAIDSRRLIKLDRRSPRIENTATKKPVSGEYPSSHAAADVTNNAAKIPRHVLEEPNIRLLSGSLQPKSTARLSSSFNSTRIRIGAPFAIIIKSSSCNNSTVTVWLNNKLTCSLPLTLDSKKQKNSENPCPAHQ